MTRLAAAFRARGQAFALRFQSADNFFMRSNWVLRASADRVSSSAWSQSSQRLRLSRSWPRSLNVGGSMRAKESKP